MEFAEQYSTTEIAQSAATTCTTPECLINSPYTYRINELESQIRQTVFEDGTKDNELLHTLRIHDSLREHTENLMDNNDIADVLLFHNVNNVDPDEDLPEGLVYNGQIVQNSENTGPLTIFGALEILGEQVRPQIEIVNVAETYGELFPSTVNITDALDLINELNGHGETAAVVKSLQVLDNLRYPLPESLSSPGEMIVSTGENGVNDRTDFRKMQEDALEAYYLYIPLMELYGYDSIVAELKEAAIRFLREDVGFAYQESLKLLENEHFSLINENEQKQGLRLFVSTVLDQLGLAEKQDFFKSDHNFQSCLEENENYENFISQVENIEETDTFSDSYALPRIRIKSVGSGFQKAIKYLSIRNSDSLPDFFESTTHQQIADTMRKLPDIVGGTIITSREKIDSIVNEFTSERNANVYEHPLGEELIEHKNKENGYKAVHVIYKEEDWPRAIELHLCTLEAYWKAAIGEASHLAYKNGDNGNGNEVFDHGYRIIRRRYLRNRETDLNIDIEIEEP